MRSGKNTFGEILKEEFEKAGISVGHDYFAKLLKEMCKKAFTPLTDYLNSFFDYEVYNPSIYVSPSFCTFEKNWYEDKNEITRLIFQGVGTDIVREINPNYWVEQFIKRVKENNNEIIICTDVRFENEIALVEKEFDTFVIRVERKSAIHDANGNVNHSSETALDNFKGWDYIINNNGTFDDLRDIAKLMVGRVQFLKSLDH